MRYLALGRPQAEFSVCCVFFGALRVGLECLYISLRMFSTIELNLDIIFGKQLLYSV